MTAPRTELERLRALEWSGNAWSPDGPEQCCPVCESEHVPNRRFRGRHDSVEGDDCWLAARIAELEDEERERDAGREYLEAWLRVQARQVDDLRRFFLERAVPRPAPDISDKPPPGSLAVPCNDDFGKWANYRPPLPNMPAPAPCCGDPVDDALEQAAEVAQSKDGGFSFAKAVEEARAGKPVTGGVPPLPERSDPDPDDYVVACDECRAEWTTDGTRHLLSCSGPDTWALFDGPAWREGRSVVVGAFIPDKPEGR